MTDLSLPPRTREKIERLERKISNQKTALDELNQAAKALIHATPHAFKKDGELSQDFLRAIQNLSSKVVV